MSSNHNRIFKQILFPVLFVLVVSAFGTSIYFFGWSRSFAPFIGFDPMEPYFADLRQVAAGVDAEDQGLNPWLENPSDPWHRVSDYPTIWFSLFRFIAKWGDPVLIFGMAQLVALLGVGLWLSRQKEGYLAILLILSPPILLGIERGNNDIAIFLLMIAGVWHAALLGGAFLGLAAALKFYPLVGIGCVIALRPNGRFLVGVALTVPLIVWSLMQLPTLLHLLPIGSYGIKSYNLVLYVFEVALVGRQSILRGPTFIIYIFYAGLFVSIFFMWHVFRVKYAKLLQTIFSLGPVFHRVALVFLATFVGIFLTGSNYPYRLIFLTPVFWVLSKVIQFNRDPNALILLIFGLVIFFLPFFPYWETLINPAVVIYLILVTPILIEACVSDWRRIRWCKDSEA